MLENGTEHQGNCNPALSLPGAYRSCRREIEAPVRRAEASGRSQSAASMRVVVVTPVGPGHDKPSLECEASVRTAWHHSHGPFVEIDHVRFDDGQGEFGRSKARNTIVANYPADWYFFIDADDLCRADAFRRFAIALQVDPGLVAVFGAIYLDRLDKRGRLRCMTIPENMYPLTWEHLMRYGPVGTLSMGCFVRADVARATPFDERRDKAEDFDFYLRLLKGRHWTKIAQPLVTIRRTVPSATGPRGYTSLDWRKECQNVVDEFKKCPTPH